MNSQDTPIAALDAGSLGAILELQTLCPEVHSWTAANWSSMLQEGQEPGVVQRRTYGIFAGPEVLAGVVAGSILEGHSELELLMVHPMRRRVGLGARLSRRWLGWAQEQGAQEVLLEVRVSNLAAQRLYRQLGFSDCARRVRYYRDPVETALVMRKLL